MSTQLYPSIWAQILFRLADIEDAPHYQVISQNHANKLEDLVPHVFPPGFIQSQRALAHARLVCRSFDNVLKLNAWWYTYWSKRSIPDIRLFHLPGKSWWQIAEHFHVMREEAKKMVVPLLNIEKTGWEWVTFNMRSLAWSGIREYEMALLDARLHEQVCPPFYKARALSNPSVIHIKRGDFSTALTLCDKALEIEDVDRESLPQQIQEAFPSMLHITLNNRGVSLTHLGRTLEAERCLQASIDKDPKFANSHLNMAYCMYKQQRLEECIKKCDEALQIKPVYPAAKLLKSHVLAVLAPGSEESETLLAECIKEAWEAGPYSVCFIHMLPIKYPNYSW